MPTLPGNLRDERAFPNFNACPSEHEIDFSYYHSSNNFLYTESRHWCLLAEIIHIQYDIRLRLVVRDRSGAIFLVIFHLEDDAATPLRCRLGETIAILYPRKHRFLDMSVGIRQEEASDFTVSIQYEERLIHR